MPPNALATTFRINQPPVIYETFEDEIVVIHLTRGSYYSLIDVAAQVWLALVNGQPLVQLVDRLAHEYAAPREQIAASVAEFIDALQAEALIAEGTSPLAPLLGGEGKESEETSPLAPLLGGEGKESEETSPLAPLLGGEGEESGETSPLAPLLGGEGDQLAPSSLSSPPSLQGKGAGGLGLSPRPFTPPRLEVFTDMQDLLLLDPIHDVDETGWPNVPPAQRPPTR